MVYTNLGFSSNPLANALNFMATRCYENAFKPDVYASLPEPKLIDYDEWHKMQDSLQPPNQLDYASNCTRIDTLLMSQQNPNLFVCPDGTMLDTKTRCVVFDPRKQAEDGCWAKTKIVNPLDDECLNATCRYFQSQTKIYDDLQSNAYWEKQREVQSRKPIDQAKARLQQELLQQFEDGMLIRKSRLEDDDGF